MNSKLFCCIFTCIFLAACGGGSDSEPPTPPNSAPVANNDTVTIQNGALSSIDVLSNDTDADNQTLSISRIAQAPSNGVATVNGSNIEYTPNSGFLGTDTLTYEVSDGSLLDTAQIAITSTASFTVEGNVAVGNAAITSVNIEVNGETTSFPIDNEGNYEASFELSSNNGEVWLNASDGNQISLSSYVGSVSELLAAQNSEFVVTPALLEGLTVDETSTAKIILAKKSLGIFDRPSSQALLEALEQYTKADFLSLAAHLRLLINDPEVIIASAETLESLFVGESTINMNVEDNLVAYLSSQDSLDQFLQFSEVYEGKHLNAIKSLLNAPESMLSFTVQELQGNRLLETSNLINYARNKVDPYSAQIREYSSDGDGRYFDPLSVSFEAFTWTITEGKISETYQPTIDENTDRISFTSFDSALDSIIPFGENALEAAQESLALGGSVALVRQLNKSDITKIDEQSNYTQAFYENTFLETLEVDDPFSNSKQIFTRNTASYKFTNVLVNVQNEEEILSEQVVIGRWSVPMLELDWTVDVEAEMTEPQTLILDRVVTFNTDGTAGIEDSDDLIGWTLNENTLTITRSDNNTVTTLTVLTGANNELFVEGEYLLNEAQYTIRAGRMIKSNIDPMSAPNIMTEAPIIWSPYSGNAYNRIAIDSETQNYTFEFSGGYLVKSDQTMERISPLLAANNQGVNTYTSDADSSAWTYEIENDIILFKQNRDFGSQQQRQWQLLRETDDGFLVVIERVNFEARPEFDTPPRTFIEDRILYLKRDDLSVFTSAYNQAVLDGVF